MKKLLVAVMLGALAVPGAAQAQTVTSTDQQNAAKQCKAMKAAAPNAEAFRTTVAAITKSSKVTSKNAYGKCVSFYAKDESEERSSAQKSAVTACKAEREAADTPEEKAAFQAKYQARNQASAYGKCVSKAAKAKKAEADANDQDKVNAAEQCDDERGETEPSREAFDRKYRNFGACVSTTAKKINEQRKAEQNSTQA